MADFIVTRVTRVKQIIAVTGVVDAAAAKAAAQVGAAVTIATTDITVDRHPTTTSVATTDAWDVESAAPAAPAPSTPTA